MKARVLLLLSAVLGADAARADAPGAPAGEWHRVLSPDKAVAVSMPCADADIQSQARPDGFAAMCHGQVISFAFAIGVQLDPGQASDYAGLLAGARKDATTGEVTLTNVAGHQAFRAAASDGSALIEVIDYQPGKPIMLMAMLKDGLDTAGRPAAQELGNKYINSLELLAK